MKINTTQQNVINTTVARYSKTLEISDDMLEILMEHVLIQEDANQRAYSLEFMLKFIAEKLEAKAGA
jgi:dsDNA-binding SOS-regulon protein